MQLTVPLHTFPGSGNVGKSQIHHDWLCVWCKWILAQSCQHLSVTHIGDYLILLTFWHVKILEFLVTNFFLLFFKWLSSCQPLWAVRLFLKSVAFNLSSLTVGCKAMCCPNAHHRELLWGSVKLRYPTLKWRLQALNGRRWVLQSWVAKLDGHLLL